MTKKRPCCICRRWFQPDPRIGARQCTCGAEECQRKRRAQTNRRWRKANPYYDAACRLQSKLDAVDEQTGPSSVPHRAGKLRVAWDVVQAEMKAKPTVILQEISRVQSSRAQAEIWSQLFDFKQRIARLQGNRAQAEMARGP